MTMPITVGDDLQFDNLKFLLIETIFLKLMTTKDLVKMVLLLNHLILYTKTLLLTIVLF